MSDLNTTVFHEKRLRNTEQVLRLLFFSGPIQRVELSRQLGIRKTSVTNIVAELLDIGLVIEEEPERLRSNVLLNGKKHYAVCATITPKAIEAARVYLDGRITDRSSIALDDDLDADTVINKTATLLKSMTPRGISKSVLGYAVSVQGIVDPSDGKIQLSSNMGGWSDVEMGAKLSSAVGQPVQVDNDVRCQLWASAWFQKLLKDMDNIFYVGVLDGIASATMIHGQMIIGTRCSAGQIGHVRAGNAKRPCKCGKLDCLEAYSCIPAILQDLSDVNKSQSRISIDSISELVDTDSRAAKIIDKAAERIATTVAGIIAGIQPQTLLLGSEDGDFSELIRPLVEKHLQSQLIGIDTGKIKILTTDSVNNTTLQGLGAIVIQRVFSNISPFQQA